MLTTTFLSPSGRLLAHEWLRYRYGVFEEVGQVGSPLHPPHYRASDASWKPNACSNAPLIEKAYETPCDPQDLGCDLSIQQEDNQGLTSSFMAFPEIPSVSPETIRLDHHFDEFRKTWFGFC